METNSNEPDEIPRASVFVSIYHFLILLGCGMVILKASDTTNFLHNYETVILVLAFGSIGGALKSSRHVVRAVRHGRYKKNRLLWQVLTPVHGATLACVGYAVLKCGIIALSTGVGNEITYKYFLMVFAFTCGFFSELFIKRLGVAAESLFGDLGRNGRTDPMDDNY